MSVINYSIRLENKDDYRAVEELIRESFWNIYRPGCSEHYVIHVLRDDPAFVKELDFVMEQDGRIIGQNMFMRTVIEADDGREIPVLTMGPICIANDLKRQGYGKAMLDYSLEKATELGFGALLLNALETYIKEYIKPDWAVSLELISSKEAVWFYRKHGFEERPCDWDGPGMFKMIR